MAYSKQTWNNGVTGGTPINADRLNHMEDGIENPVDSIPPGTYVPMAGTAGLSVTATAQAGQLVVANPALNSIAAGGLANTISGGGTSGSPNKMSGVVNFSTIGGGYDNDIQSTSIGAITISGGAHHRVSGAGGVTHATIGGGSFGTISAASGVTNDYSTIGGGSTHTIAATSGTGSITAATISGGGSHVASASYTTIGGGNGNTASAQFATIAGGNTNVASGQNSICAGGSTNTASGASATVSGGSSNQATSTYSTVSGGFTNVAATSQYGTIGGGRQNQVNADYGTVPGGYLCQANATYSIATGRESVTTIYGQHAQAAGKFATAGDGQWSRVVLRRVSTNATPGELRADAGSNRNLLASDNTVWGFTLKVTGKLVGGTTCARYRFEGLVVRGTGVASLALKGTPVKYTDYEDVAGWDVAVSVDTTNGSLVINSTGEAATNINWLGVLELEQVGG